MTHLQQLHEALGQADNLTIFAISLCPDEVWERNFTGQKTAELLPLVKAGEYQAIIARIGDDCAVSRQSKDIFVTILNREEQKTALQTVAEKNPGEVALILGRLSVEERAGLVTAKLLQTVAEKEPWEVRRILGCLPKDKRAGLVTAKLLQTVAEKKPWEVELILDSLPKDKRAGLVTAKLMQTVAEKDPGWVAFILGRLPEDKRAGLVTAKLLQTVAAKDPKEVKYVLDHLSEKEQGRLRQEMVRLRQEMAANKKTSEVLQRVLVNRQNQR